MADGIVATVNDKIITGYDLRQRMLMLIASSQVQPTEQNLPAIQQAALNALIEDRLKVQEMAKFESLKVTDEEVDQEIAEMARAAGTTPANYLQFLQQGGIQPAAFRENLRTQIGWSQLVPGRFNSRARASSLQVDQELRRLNEAASKPQFLLGEIYIDAARVGGAQAALNGARQLVQQIIQGAPFQAVAQQFSSAPSANAACRATRAGSCVIRCSRPSRPWSISFSPASCPTPSSSTAGSISSICATSATAPRPAWFRCVRSWSNCPRPRPKRTSPPPPRSFRPCGRA